MKKKSIKGLFFCNMASRKPIVMRPTQPFIRNKEDVYKGKDWELGGFGECNEGSSGWRTGDDDSFSTDHSERDMQPEDVYIDHNDLGDDPLPESSSEEELDTDGETETVEKPTKTKPSTTEGVRAS